MVVGNYVIASDRRERGNLMLGIRLQELRSPRRFAPRDDDRVNAFSDGFFNMPPRGRLPVILEIISLVKFGYQERRAPDLQLLRDRKTY